jgi:ABC-type transport system substrate-binding protein
MRQFLIPVVLVWVAACWHPPASAKKTIEVTALRFDNLTLFVVGGRLVSGLARTWETDAAGTGYTFHLRSGVAHD